jgi:hypothetical protein
MSNAQWLSVVVAALFIVELAWLMCWGRDEPEATNRTVVKAWAQDFKRRQRKPAVKLVTAPWANAHDTELGF